MHQWLLCSLLENQLAWSRYDRYQDAVVNVVKHAYNHIHCASVVPGSAMDCQYVSVCTFKVHTAIMGVPRYIACTANYRPL